MMSYWSQKIALCNFRSRTAERAAKSFAASIEQTPEQNAPDQILMMLAAANCEQLLQNCVQIKFCAAPKEATWSAGLMTKSTHKQRGSWI